MGARAFTEFRGCMMMRWLSVILLSVAVSSCGYQLSGSTSSQAHPLAPVLKRVSFEGLGKYESFRQTLGVLVRSYGIRVMKPGFETARVIFLDEQEKETVVAVGDDAKAREYLLTVSRVFEVRSGGQDGKILIKQQEIQASASYLYSPDRLLASNNERRRALDNIERHLAQKLMDRLIALSARLATATQ